jgi:hypothetical protein
MRILLIACLLLAGANVHACEITAGPGAVIRLSEGKSGGLATVGCVFGEKWELRAYWIGEQRLYDGAVVIDAYPALSVSRLWMFREGKRIRPVLGMGLLVKGAQRCRYNGELNCNRQLPLPFAFLPSIGAKVGDVLITFSHASNSSLDYGPEKKNLGLDSIRAEVWF